MKLRISVGIIILGLSAAAFADNFYVSPGVAYYHFSEKRDLQNTAMANLTAGYIVSDQVSLEAFYGQAATEETPSALDKDTRFYLYSGNGVYHFSSDANAIIHPYALGGLSITNQLDDSDGAGNTTLLGINAGLGLEYVVNPNISLFTDVRDIYTLSGGKNDWMLSAGLKFSFGGSTEKEVPAPVKTDGTSGFYQLQDQSQING